MSDVVFRRAETADLPFIVGLLADDPIGASREDLSTPLNRAYIDAFNAIAADPNQFLAVITEDDQVIGTLQLTFIPGLSRTGAWRGQIEAVRIAAHRRGTGLGHRAFEWAVQQCQSRKCSLVQLTTDKNRPEAHRFYEQLGFAASHLGYKRPLDV
ncbi:MAG: GNAT family N-acetyltransferase [Brevundimonas sp.]|uniref:GNAT family N-acetyltransferase n=1 Tax=Brevundimonas sp. TaxID=1871086 RepID=UPI0027368800|nr:GNAT family N-acetyltransferase [Brevundimonas sp.]MDP3376735.1 GNAT family N-acetyltransferase [Brevundimonas sp.]